MVSDLREAKNKLIDIYDCNKANKKNKESRENLILACYSKTHDFDNMEFEAAPIDISGYKLALSRFFKRQTDKEFCKEIWKKLFEEN